MHSQNPPVAEQIQCSMLVSESSTGGAAGQLVAMQQGPLYIQLPHMRLAVVHEKYWRAILHKDKLIEFRSSKHPTMLDAGNCLLFALAMRHRRGGKDDLIL